jgi:hypothetical protein
MKRVVRLLPLVLLAALASSAVARAQAEQVDEAVLNPGDQLWLVSCRALPGVCVDDAVSRLIFWQHTCSGWNAASAESFFAPTDPAMVTTVFAAGNGYSHAETAELGSLVYQNLAEHRLEKRPWRLVIWSWPSDRAKNKPLEDLRIKSARTPVTALYLAQFLEKLNPASSVSLIGTSFGAKIAVGALHLLNGGKVEGLALDGARQQDRAPVRVVLISAAIDDGALLPGGCYDRALSLIDQMLLINNHSDRALKRYRWMYGVGSDAKALGHKGLTTTWGHAGLEKVVQFDASLMIGHKHGCRPYFQEPALLAMMRPYVLFEN